MTPEEAPLLSMRNRAALQQESTASCYACCHQFIVSEIDEWVDEGLTALCPRCGIDAVVPGLVPKADLAAAEKRWFTIEE